MTALTSISNKAKEFFIKRKVVSCRDLVENNREMMQQNPYIHKNDFQKVEDEIKEICKMARKNYDPRVLAKITEMNG
jgi:hypothetical protein